MALVPIKYVQVQMTDGRPYRYYRRGPIRARLPGEPGSAEWNRAFSEAEAAYEASRCRRSASGAPPLQPGSIGALIASYRGTTAWAKLAPSTRADYEKGLGWLSAHHAHRPVATLQRPQAIKLRELAAWDVDPETKKRIMVPSRANKVLTMLSILMEHAIDTGLRKDNPALGVGKLAVDGEGYRPWQPDEVSKFLAEAHPFWRLALTLALCTGQRSQDVVRIRWTAYDGTAIEVAQEKTGAKVWIPVHPRLKALLDQSPRGGSHILMRPDRRPVKKGQPPRAATPWPANAFQKAAGRAIKAAGLSGVVWHGLRPTAASWLAEGGCSDAEIMSITGHTTAKMAQHYRRGARQKSLATSAVAKMRMRHDGE